MCVRNKYTSVIQVDFRFGLDSKLFIYWFQWLKNYQMKILINMNNI